MYMADELPEPFITPPDWFTVMTWMAAAPARVEVPLVMAITELVALAPPQPGFPLVLLTPPAKVKVLLVPRLTPLPATLRRLLIVALALLEVMIPPVRVMVG